LEKKTQKKIQIIKFFFKVVSFDELFKPPGRYGRPKRMVLVLRGLPGSGKTPFAKAVKQLEATYTKEAPRILSINDYFESDGEVHTFLLYFFLASIMAIFSHF